jgi:hypothetical protein
MLVGMMAFAAPAVAAPDDTVTDYGIVKVVAGPTGKMIVTAQAHFCAACNGNSAVYPGCEPPFCGWTACDPPPVPYGVMYSHTGQAAGRYVAVRVIHEKGPGVPPDVEVKKIVCDPANWPLSQIVKKDLEFDFSSKGNYKVEIDAYCSWCGHWYAQSHIKVEEFIDQHGALQHKITGIVGPCCVSVPPNDGVHVEPDEQSLVKTLPIKVDIVHSLYLNTTRKDVRDKACPTCTKICANCGELFASCAACVPCDKCGTCMWRCGTILPCCGSKCGEKLVQKDWLDLGNVSPLKDLGQGKDGIDLVVFSNDEWCKDISWTALTGISTDDAAGKIIPADRLEVYLDGTQIFMPPGTALGTWLPWLCPPPHHSEHKSVENIEVKFKPQWCDHAGKYEGSITVSATQI